MTKSPSVKTPPRSQERNKGNKFPFVEYHMEIHDAPETPHSTPDPNEEALLRKMILDLSPDNFDGLKNKVIANVKQGYYYIQLLKLLG